MERNGRLINIWLWGIPFMYISFFSLFLTYRQGFGIEGLIFYLILGVSSGLLWGINIFNKQHYRHIAFYLFEYEKYSKDRMLYEKRYFYITQSEYYLFFFKKHIKTIKDDVQKEIIKKRKRLLENNDFFLIEDLSYKTKEAMLENIKIYIEDFYKSMKSKEVYKNRIRNISQIDIIDFSEELKKLENGI
jgi:hypothetical protein